MGVRTSKTVIRQIALHENLRTAVPALLLLVEKIAREEVGICSKLVNG